jgi:hypothetical protein
MANTTNYNWETPDDTDLVKDGAAAIRTLGNSIDTTTKNLNPETTTGDIAYRSATANTNTRLPIGSTGQVLTVAAGVPSWATPSDQTPLTTKGDVFTFSTVDARLGVGANGTVLTADSTEATGLKWVAPSGSSGPAFRAFRNTSTQSVTGDTWTKVQLNGETFDTASCFDSTTNFRFTPNVAGYYNLTGKLNGEAQESIGIYVWSAIYKNGAEASLGTKGSAPQDEGTSIVSDLIYLNGTTDYVELYGYIRAGTPSEYFYNGTAKTYFEGVWIRS